MRRVVGLALATAITITGRTSAGAQSVSEIYDYVRIVKVGPDADNFLLISVYPWFKATQAQACSNPSYAQSKYPLTDERTQAWMKVALASLIAPKTISVTTDGCTSDGRIVLAGMQLIRGLPDLIATIQLNPPSPRLGDPLSFTVRVTNEPGAGPADPCTLEFGAGTLVGTTRRPVPRLLPGETHQVSFPAGIASVGNYTSRATADVGNEVSESDESNNVAGRSFTITTPTCPAGRTYNPACQMCLAPGASCP